MVKEIHEFIPTSFFYGQYFVVSSVDSYEIEICSVTGHAIHNFLCACFSIEKYIILYSLINVAPIIGNSPSPLR